MNERVALPVRLKLGRAVFICPWCKSGVLDAGVYAVAQTSMGHTLHGKCPACGKGIALRPGIFDRVLASRKYGRRKAAKKR